MMKGIQFARNYLGWRFLKHSALIVTSVFCLASCKKSADDGNSPECSGSVKSYAADVKPIVQASCAFDSDCHGSGSSSGPGSLLTYFEIFEARSAIRSAVLSREMPKDETLTAAQKNAIICWIDDGAVNN
ncbi:MAG TPA: hypothetical protein VFP87_01670 [Chitinophagaceae bacterium]|nr:hypothetical protein [Chitinophagaceae bacterium]